MKYSPSNINHFFECPYKFKLKKIDNVLQIPVERVKADVGHNVHAMIKTYHTLMTVKPTPKQVENVAMDCFTQMLDPALKPYEQDILQLIKNFIKIEQSRLKDWRPPVLLEQSLEDENFTGIVDYFDGSTIIDWKTGNLMNISDNERRQGKIYDILIQHSEIVKQYPPPYKIYFAALKNARLIEIPFTTEAWLMSQIEKMYEMVKANIFPKCRCGLCNYCEVQLACEFDELTIFTYVTEPIKLRLGL